MVCLEVKRLLKDAIVVGHNIQSDERALCFPDQLSSTLCIRHSDKLTTERGEG